MPRSGRKKSPRKAGGGQAGGKKVVTQSIPPRLSASSGNLDPPPDSTPERFVKLPKRILRSVDLSPKAKLIYAAIVDRIGKNGEAWSGQPVIAADVGMSVSTVKRAILELSAAGLVATSSRGPGLSLLYKRGNLGQPDLGQPDLGQPDLGQPDLRGSVNLSYGVGQPELIENETHERDPLNETNERSIKTKHPTFAQEEIERIYEAYPRKVGRRAALKAIEKALRVLAERGTQDPTTWLLQRVEKYAGSAAGRRGKFTPHPATWFNQERYDDDDREWANTSRNDRSQAASPARSRAEAGKYDGI